MKPIGYWLNRTDQAITDHMTATLAAFGLTRVGWQILNLLKDGASEDEVFSTLRANADAATLRTTLDAVLAAGWTTPEGQARLSEVAERVNAFRELSMTGISMDDYRTTISVLERMTANLEGAR